MLTTQQDSYPMSALNIVESAELRWLGICHIEVLRKFHRVIGMDVRT